MTRDGLRDVEDEGGEAVARAALPRVVGGRRILLLLLRRVHQSSYNSEKQYGGKNLVEQPNIRRERPKQKLCFDTFEPNIEVQY